MLRYVVAIFVSDPSLVIFVIAQKIVVSKQHIIIYTYVRLSKPVSSWVRRLSGDCNANT
jgi:hypothetical protein